MSMISVNSALAPLVSVIVPTFNEKVQVIQQSLGSISTQTFVDFECLVIDESTIPELANACQAFCEGDSRFQYIRPEKRLGLAGSLNYGIENAKGDLIARFDSDDVCSPDRLMLQVNFLKEHPEVDILGGGLEIIDEEGIPIAVRRYPSDHSSIRRNFHFTTPIAHPTVMARKFAVSAAGGYNTRFPCAEDLELWLRLLDRGCRFANLQQVLVSYRQGDSKRSSRHWSYNLRARLRNLNVRSFPIQMIGLGVLSVFACLPGSVQVRLYRNLLLQNKPSSRPEICDSSTSVISEKG